MDDEIVREGTVSYSVPSLETPCSTYYKTVGDIRSKTPLVVLHGGPGSGHEYLLTFAKLWRLYKIPVIFYDQIGCASSTHLRQKADDKDFWSVELFVKDLENLIDHLCLRDGPGFDILGHSWGGVLASYFASRQPQGLRKLIIAGTPAVPDHHPANLRMCWKQLSQEAQQALDEAFRTGDFESQRYMDSYMSMRRMFWCRADPFPPKEVLPALQNQADDSTVAIMMYGSNPFFCTGVLHGFRLIPVLSNITAPTLVYRGEFDFVPEEAIVPFMDHIPEVRMGTIADASHMAHVDNEKTQEAVLELVGSFLLEDRVS